MKRHDAAQGKIQFANPAVMSQFTNNAVLSREEIVEGVDVQHDATQPTETIRTGGGGTSADLRLLKFET